MVFIGETAVFWTLWQHIVQSLFFSFPRDEAIHPQRHALEALCEVVRVYSLFVCYALVYLFFGGCVGGPEGQGLVFLFVWTSLRAVG